MPRTKALELEAPTAPVDPVAAILAAIEEEVQAERAAYDTVQAGYNEAAQNLAAARNRAARHAEDLPSVPSEASEWARQKQQLEGEIPVYTHIHTLAHANLYQARMRLAGALELAWKRRNHAAWEALHEAEATLAVEIHEAQRRLDELKASTPQRTNKETELVNVLGEAWKRQIAGELSILRQQR